MTMSSEQRNEIEALHKTVDGNVLVRIRALTPVLNKFYDDDRRWGLDWLFWTIQKEGYAIVKVPARPGSREQHRYITESAAENIGNAFVNNYDEWKARQVKQDQINIKHEKAHKEFLAQQSERAQYWERKRAVDKIKNKMRRDIADRRAATQAEHAAAGRDYNAAINAANLRCQEGYIKAMAKIDEDMRADVEAIEEACEAEIAQLPE